MPKDHDNGTVKYTVKELLDKISHNIDRIDEKLDRKADAAALAAAVGRIEVVASQGEQARTERDEVRRQLQELRDQSISKAAVDKYKQAIWATFGAAGLSLVVALFQAFR